MKLNINTFIVCGLAMLGLSSCDDTLDINADYVETPVVYGLINQDDQTHLVKVNKLYQTTDNALVAAQDESIQTYENLQAVVKMVNPNTGDTIATYPLMDTIITDRDSGTFYYPNQKMYYFNAQINQFNVYYFEMIKEDGGKATAETRIINSDGVRVLSTPNQWGGGVPFYNATGVSTIQFDVNVPLYARSYEVKMSFSYLDVYHDGTVSDTNTITNSLGFFDLGTPVLGKPFQQEELEFSGIVLYNMVARDVPDIADDPEVAVRIVDLSNCIEFSIWMANEEFSTFRELNQPSSSLLDENPFYGNVNGGEGLFANRGFDDNIVGMSKSSYVELASGVELGLTGGKGFCDIYPPSYVNCAP